MLLSQISPVCFDVYVFLICEQSFPIELLLITLDVSYNLLMGPVGLGMYDTPMYIFHMVEGVVSTTSISKPPLLPFVYRDVIFVD